MKSKEGNNGMEADWTGGVAVVTGAGSGIGAGIARAAAAAGMIVVVTDLAIERAETVAGEINASGGSARAVKLDVTDEAAVRTLAEKLHEGHGGVRLLVNNAGIMNFGPSWEMGMAQWREVLDVNLIGVLHGISAFVPRMVERGRAGTRGAVVNVASLASISALPMSAAYVMSKHAVLALSECLSLELALEELPVDISVVLPGVVDTGIYNDSVMSRGKVDTGGRIRSLLQGMSTQYGMSPDEAGRIIFEKVQAREFWVATDPDLTRQTLTGRADFLLGQQPPQLPPAMVDSLRGIGTAG